MAREERENKRGLSFFSSLFFLVGLGILVMIGISLGKETYRKRQIQKEIEKLQAEIQKINQENNELSNLISYLSTQEFQEKEAREKLNLQKEDEKLIMLRKETEAQPSPTQSGKQDSISQNTAPSRTSNLKDWLVFFFADKK